MPVDLHENITRVIEDKYGEELEKSVERRRGFFVVDFMDLDSESRKKLNTDYMNEVTTGTSLNDLITAMFNKVAREKDMNVRFSDVALFFENVQPVRKMRDLSSDHMNGLMGVNGIVTSTTPPHSIIKKAHFKCEKCGETIVVNQPSTELMRPSKCIGRCKEKRRFVLLETESEWEDYQEMTIQENPEEVDAGVIPRTLKGRLRGKELIDICKPGEQVDVMCALVPTPLGRSSKGRIFSWVLDVNYVEVLTKDSFSIELSERDMLELEDLASHPNIRNIILKSIFPYIHGRDMEKMGLVLSTLSGVTERKQGTTRRGTINVLLIGDPSTGKTRMLDSMVHAAPKAIYASGKSATGVGLTASAVQDHLGWRLEAGAVVLADMGLAAIDEIDKMTDDDREKLNQAMSVLKVSIHKANIHATLNARTSIIAAANPTHGRYDKTEYLTDNINLSPTTLARFDLIFIIEDVPDEEEDVAVIDKVLGITEEDDVEVIDIPTLKKYILYAKSIDPVLTEEAINKIKEYYLTLRKLSMRNNPIAISIRQGEGLRRLTEASARMLLKKEATVEDAEIAIELVRSTLEKAGYDPKSGKVDVDIFEGKPKNKKHRMQLIEKVLLEANGPMHITALEERVSDYGIELEELRKLLDEMLRSGSDIYCPQPPDVYMHQRNAAFYRPYD